jgi:hypothetical protein
LVWSRYERHGGDYERCRLTTRWSGPGQVVGRTLVANRWLAGSACGKRHRARPLNSVVSQQREPSSRR